MTEVRKGMKKWSNKEVVIKQVVVFRSEPQLPTFGVSLIYT